MYWMKYGTSLRTQQRLLQKKLASIHTESEAEQPQTDLDPFEPRAEGFPAKKAKKTRKRQKARVRVAEQSVPNTGMEPATAVETPSVVGFDAKLESESDAGSRDLASVEAEPADAAETPSVVEFDAKLESESDACSKDLANVEAELLPSFFDQQKMRDHDENTDNVYSVQASDKTASDKTACMGKGKACEMDATNEVKISIDTV